jgi:DNA polymerase II
MCSSRVVGLHDNVWVFDFKSLYPSIIRTFNIDPLGFVAEPGAGDDLIVLESGAAFPGNRPSCRPCSTICSAPRGGQAPRRRRGVPGHQDPHELVLRRARHAGLPFSQPGHRQRHHRPGPAPAAVVQGLVRGTGYPCCTAIPTACSSLPAWRIRRRPRRGRGAGGGGQYRSVHYIEGRWRVQSALELEFEKLYVKLILPSVRHGAGGARKRYAGLRRAPRRRTSSSSAWRWCAATGRSWPSGCSASSTSACSPGAPVDAYLRSVVAALRAASLTTCWSTARGCASRSTSYTASTPPHVAAARQSAARPGRVISYLMTVAGPQPLDALTAPPGPGTLSGASGQSGGRAGAAGPRARVRAGDRRRPPDGVVLSGRVSPDSNPAPLCCCRTAALRRRGCC